VNGPYFANVLSQRLGYNIRSGEAYYTPGCATTAQCVFPGAVIPQRAWSSPAQKLLSRVPSPNAGDSTLSTGAFAQTVRDDKGSMRIDGNTKLLGLLTGYYFVDDYTLDNPYPGQQGGANVPGFDAQTIGRAQLFTLSSGKTFGRNTVNDFHVSLTHNANNAAYVRGTGRRSPGSSRPRRPASSSLLRSSMGRDLVFNTFTMGDVRRQPDRARASPPAFEGTDRTQ
jgi:hypothetical protein